MRPFFFTLLAFFLPLIVLAQANRISGIATDENDDPLVGATITILKDGKEYISAITDLDGQYIVSVPEGKFAIRGIYPGYLSVNIINCSSDNENTKIDLHFKPREIEEVFVIYCRALYRDGVTNSCWWENEHITRFFDEKMEPWFYPNATSDILNLSYKDASGTFYITDMTGRLVRTFMPQSETKSTIDASDMAAGTYVISYHYKPDNRVSGKFIVLR